MAVEIFGRVVRTILLFLLNEGETHLTDISFKNKLAFSNLQVRVNELEKEGYVKTEMRRKWRYVSLTERGRKTANWIQKIKDQGMLT